METKLKQASEAKWKQKQLLEAVEAVCGGSVADSGSHHGKSLFVFLFKQGKQSMDAISGSKRVEA